MAREILFKKSKGNEYEKSPVPSKVPKEEKINESIVDWLDAHPLINISGLCRLAAINRANFDKYLKMKEIPQKHETTLINILKKYGYGS
jgi:hypothetical protein